MHFVSSNKFIAGYLVGAGLMWLLFYFDYIPKMEKKLEKARQHCGYQNIPQKETK